MNIGEEILIDYLSGELDLSDQQQVEQALQKDEDLREQLEQLKRLRTDIEELPLHQPSMGLKNRFQTLLEEEKEKMPPANHQARLRPLKKWRRQIISAAAILIVGVLAGLLIQTYRVQQQQIAAIQAELQATRNQMNALLSANSTTKRIQAVYMSMDLPEADQEIIDQLIQLIHRDESANVRLAAIDALTQFDQGPTAQKALTIALRMENKPVVQIALIHALVKIKALEAIPVMEELIEKEETFDKVKDEARLGTFKLS